MTGTELALMLTAYALSYIFSPRITIFAAILTVLIYLATHHA